LRHLSVAFSQRILGQEPLVITMEEAFIRWAGFSLSEEYENLFEQCKKHGLLPDGNETWEMLFNWLFVSLIETSLPSDRPVFVTDYPSRVPTLSAPCADSRFTQRWELYVGKLEIANCFTEAASRDLVQAHYDAEKVEYDANAWAGVDLDFPKLCGDMPQCSGAAVGLDRLFMACTGSDCIDDVLFFPYSGALKRQTV
jgi:lysyl-tRNA synthetase class 2